MATSTMLPASCPICGRDFSGEAAGNIPPHIAAHLAVYFTKKQSGLPMSDASSDW